MRGLQEIHSNSSGSYGTFPKLGARCQIGEEAVASRGQDGRRSERGLGQKQHINDVPSIAILDAGSTPLPNRKVRRGAGERSCAFLWNCYRACNIFCDAIKGRIGKNLHSAIEF